MLHGSFTTVSGAFTLNPATLKLFRLPSARIVCMLPASNHPGVSAVPRREFSDSGEARSCRQRDVTSRKKIHVGGTGCCCPGVRKNWKMDRRRRGRGTHLGPETGPRQSQSLQSCPVVCGRFCLPFRIWFQLRHFCIEGFSLPELVISLCCRPLRRAATPEEMLFGFRPVLNRLKLH